MASSHDQETERFLSTGTTGRRVSFNEAALFDHGKKTQEKGRRLESKFIHKGPLFMFSIQLSLMSNLTAFYGQTMYISDCLHFTCILV